MSCQNGCRPPCQCSPGHSGPYVPGPDGSRIMVQPAGGSGQSLCWGVAGGEAALTNAIGAAPAPIPAGTTGFIRINVTNYSWLKPRKLTTTCVDPLLPGVNMAAQVRVLEVQAVGKQVIGSAAGINSSSIDSESQNALTFGDDIPSISSANFIVVTVRNDSAAALNISADVEGQARQ